MAYQRILRGAPATVPITFLDQHGEPRAVTDVSATITRADGTDLFAGVEEPASGFGSGLFGESEFGTSEATTHEVLLHFTPEQTAELDSLTGVATAGDGSKITFAIDIVGGYLFSLAEARSQEPTLASKTDEQLRRIRDVVEAEAEHYCHRAFVPRLLKMTVPVRDIRSAGQYLADLVKWRTFLLGGLRFASPAAVGPIFSANAGSLLAETTVTLYAEVGMTHIPPDFKRAAIARMKDILTDRGAHFDPRATSISNEQGTFSLVTPGVKGARTETPAWNVALDEMTWDNGSVMSVAIR